MDQQRVEGLVREILLELGENPDREGLQDTPRRVASMFQEVFAGIRYTNAEIASMCDRKFRVETTDPIIIRDIPCFSYCEHHMALMYNMKITIGYVPQGYVLGLSKFPRQFLRIMPFAPAADGTNLPRPHPPAKFLTGSRTVKLQRQNAEHPAKGTPRSHQ